MRPLVGETGKGFSTSCCDGSRASDKEAAHGLAQDLGEVGVGDAKWRPGSLRRGSQLHEAMTAGTGTMGKRWRAGLGPVEAVAQIRQRWPGAAVDLRSECAQGEGILLGQLEAE